MKIFQKWMNDDYARGFLYFSGIRGPFNLHKNDALTPYFQYRIGVYQNDYYIYFPEEPNKFQYATAIFDKMYEYRGHDLIKYIEFHYKLYEDKADFVRFLRDEAIRHKRDLRKYRWFFWMPLTNWKASLEDTMRWVEEEGKRLENPAVPLVPETPQEALAAGMEGIVDKFEEDISALLRTHQGRIDLYNEHHMTKVIQLLHLLQHLREPGKKGGLLFKTFSDMDMAAVLRQFEPFRDYKTNTLQVKISNVKKEMDLNDPALEKLAKALQDFFFP